jgi:hypothetical protein
VGDIDGDGALDIAGTTGDAKGVEWYKNPGDGSAEWQAYQVGSFEEAVYPDRTELADLNGDGRLDIIVTEENGEDKDAKTFWWAQPEDPTNSSWARSPVTTQGSTNSLDVADMDGDGDMDIILAEHRGSRKIAIWANDGVGNFSEHIVDTGKESHLGAQTVDIDGDGDLDIVSIAWDDGNLLQLWRNDASNNGEAMENGSIPTAAENIETELPAATTPEPEPGTKAAAVSSTDPIALYLFDSGSGDIVKDVSGQGEPLDLQIGDESAVSWLPDGGVSINVPTIISAGTAADKLVTAIKKTNAFSIAAWVKPLNVDQDGPARIVTFSNDPFNRNFTLGQEFGSYDVRVRTTNTTANGTPSLTTESDTVSTERTYLVYVHDSQGVSQIFLDGEQVAETEITGDFSGWDENYTFALANELTNDRPWLGDLYSVAIYDRALSAEEIGRQFQQGVPALQTAEGMPNDDCAIGTGHSTG